MPRLDRVVVVGAGLAGVRAAQELRAQGFGGSITLLGAEDRRPYDRPPLAKQLLLASEGSELPDPSLDVDLDLLDVEFRRPCVATGLEAEAVLTADGPVPFDGLVIASGAAPVVPPGWNGAVLRTLDDAVALRARLVPGATVVVVGAGWIGAEVATAAAARGCEVTVVEAAPAPVTAALGREVGAAMTPWYAEAGVALRLGMHVVEVAPDRVVTADGRVHQADVVLIGVGVRPSTSWAVGLEVDDRGALLVDETMQASRRGVVAVGDCVSRWSPRWQVRITAEHWDEALHSPEAAVGTLLGEPSAYDPVPYVWSEQFGRMVQYVGHASSADRLVWRGDPSERAWAAAWLAADGRMSAMVTVDSHRDSTQARKAIAAGTRPDPDRLRDPSIAVRDC